MSLRISKSMDCSQLLFATHCKNLPCATFVAHVPHSWHLLETLSQQVWTGTLPTTSHPYNPDAIQTDAF